MKVTFLLLLTVFSTFSFAQTKANKTTFSGAWHLDIMRNSSGNAVDITSGSWEEEEVFAYLTFSNDKCIISNGLKKNTIQWNVINHYLILKKPNQPKLKYKIISHTKNAFVIEYPVGIRDYVRCYYKKQKAK